MSDSLMLLREYNIQKKEIQEQEGQIIFDGLSFPNSLKTNYESTRSRKNRNADAQKEYYTLECLLLFLKNANVIHPEYCKLAAAKNIPAVYRPDRRDLLSFLNGETSTSTRIDSTAPLALPLPSKVKRRIDSDDDLEVDKKPRIELIEETHSSTEGQELSRSTSSTQVKNEK